MGQRVDATNELINAPVAFECRSKLRVDVCRPREIVRPADSLSRWGRLSRRRSGNNRFARLALTRPPGPQRGAPSDGLRDASGRWCTDPEVPCWRLQMERRN